MAVALHIRDLPEDIGATTDPKLFRPDSGEIGVKPGTVQGMAPLTKFRSLLTARRNPLPRHTVVV